MHSYLMFAFHFFTFLSIFLVVVLHIFFSFGRQIKWSLVTLDRWLSYKVTTVWEFAWADSALIVLDAWVISYRC